MIDLSLSKQLLSLVHMADQPIQSPVNNVGAAQAVLAPSQNPQQAVVQEQAQDRPSFASDATQATACCRECPSSRRCQFGGLFPLYFIFICMTRVARVSPIQFLLLYRYL